MDAVAGGSAAKPCGKVLGGESERKRKGTFTHSTSPSSRMITADLPFRVVKIEVKTSQ